MRTAEATEWTQEIGQWRREWSMHGSAEQLTPWASWRRVLVVGLGKTGLSCARFLAARGLEVAVTDSRVQPPGLDALREELPDAALFLGEFVPEAFAAADAVLVSPGVAVREPLIAQAAQRGVPVLGDVDLFAAVAGAPVIAITGSNGKSTVTTLVGEMARRAELRVGVGGNLGTPLLELLDAAAQLYVIELSSFQLETAHRLNAAAATVLNLSEDHMDRYDDLESYRAAKQRIYRGDGAMVINADDPQVAAMAQRGRRLLTFSLGAPAADGYGLVQRGGGSWLARGAEPLLAVEALRMAGRHNIANALAALALGEAAGLPRAAMLDALREFPGLAHRCQLVAERDGVAWYNDSKATNVGAAVAALEGFERPLILIAGGDAKGADLMPLRAPVARRARAAVLLGRDTERLAEALADAVPLHRVASIEEAVQVAAGLAQAGDAVLLAPACASLDMFRNFEERGERFAAAVRGLGT